MPVALISTSTSPARGPSSSTSSMVSGAPAFQATAALVFMLDFLVGPPNCMGGVVNGVAPKGPAKGPNYALALSPHAGRAGSAAMGTGQAPDGPASCSCRLPSHQPSSAQISASAAPASATTAGCPDSASMAVFSQALTASPAR